MKPTHFLARTSLWAAMMGFTPGALADPPPPKVCVAVAGDPDESVRAAAEALTLAIGGSDALRGVADADSRAALRGEPSPPESSRDLSDARRALRGHDEDRATLDPVAERLGCAWFVEVSARPAGLSLRLYDVVHHTWQEAPTMPTVEASVVSRWILASTRAQRPPEGPAQPPERLRAAPAQSSARVSLLQRSWPWFLAGAAAAGVITVFLLTRDEAPGDVRFRVVHGGAR